ncbi:indolepyruvate ferredoxin oxidoreductase family protein [Polycladidibacter stylochi]|uniref:indolepyruvate ferredoxin oxidoreductase family protein n=1 Tax=Polycladidibacter stylochi TaxID=1807766 RepID=UPI00082C2851|nr:indolepyruvate ferredoxin oxidoreductase family protein [Pseudovibrio stylochi]
MAGLTRPVRLDDKYTQDFGGIYLTGIQALVRLALDRARLDRTSGLNTAGFISGYRGSPLAGFDSELTKTKRYLDDGKIHFQPGVNEELGATAVWGTQKVRQHGRGANCEGVFGIWYGKAPGVDRAGDVLRQANASGTDPNGGVVALAGDDHLAKSSILPAQSEFFFQHVEMPVFNPADIQEVLDYGLHAFELSRYSGLWSALICLADTMDASATIRVDDARLRFIRPREEDPRLNSELNRVLLLGNRLETERLLRDIRLPAVRAYVRANRLDRIAFGAKRPRLGLIASGKAYRDLCQALQLCGIDEVRAREMGLSVYKVAVPYPLEPQGIAEFARGLERVFVVEHKRAFMEPQIKEIAYGWPNGERPQIFGKYDCKGQPLLTDVLELSVLEIILGLARFLPKELQSSEMKLVADQMMRQQMWAQGHEEKASRVPYFCSGCPHNTSTVVPEGARAMPGIGCHAMTEISGRTTDGQVAMGGEGTLWVGQAAFSKDKHVFANMGDGTYFHSGILAIRQAVAAKVSITFKVLYNDAVAMTGGQPIDGPLSVAQLVAQLEAEGVERVVLLSEEPERYGQVERSKGLIVHERDALMQVQEELAALKGVTAIVYDQTCAAEKRRRRKRGLLAESKRRVFINHRVCEGCGDCSTQSNCLSIEPLATAYGEKRQVNQTSCNKDFSCVKGFCPSFVYVEGAEVCKEAGALEEIEALLPKLPKVVVGKPVEPINLLIAGVGGMGVTTIAAILAMAGHMEGLQASTLDMTGLAQKGGPVTSHVRFAATDETIQGPRVPPAQLDVLLASDLLVASKAEQLSLLNKERSFSFVNSRVLPTSEFVMAQKQSFVSSSMLKNLSEGCLELHSFDTYKIAEKLLGDGIYSNMLLVGMAYQAGRLPLQATSIEKAIELNGAAPRRNILAFQAGRLLYAMPKELESLMVESKVTLPSKLEDQIDFYRQELIAYQNEAYGATYEKLIKQVMHQDRERGGVSLLATRVATRGLYKVMAYKDEYEVARLYSDGTFLKRLKRQFTNPKAIKILVAPPLWPLGKDKKTGKPRKVAIGQRWFWAFRLLARFKFLRETRFDAFGYTIERRSERLWRDQYMRDVMRVCRALGVVDYNILVELLSLPDKVSGYGVIKAESLEKAQVRRKELLGLLEDDPSALQYKVAAE